MVLRCVFCMCLVVHRVLLLRYLRASEARHLKHYAVAKVQKKLEISNNGRIIWCV